MTPIALSYPRVQLSLVRWIVGLGFAIYFLSLMPYAPELARVQSFVIPLSSLGIVNPFAYMLDMAAIKTLMLLLAVASVLLATGFARRNISVLLLVFFLFTIDGIAMLPTPLDGFAPFLLLLFILAPQAPDRRLSENTLNWIRLAFGLSLVTFAATHWGRTESIPYALSGILWLHPLTRSTAWPLSVLLFIFLPVVSVLGLFLLSVAACLLILDSSALFPGQKIRAPFSQTIFIDGECVLCNWFAEFLLEFDRRKIFRIASLQGSHAKSEVPDQYRNSLASLVLKQDGELYIKSRAVILILSNLGGVWLVFRLFRLLPSAILDFMYDLVAKHRYRIFGKFDSCRLPSAEERARLLD